ncbi:MAG: FHA domain-containing protein [Planctomycetes bacterium]|nr:FHA domain-containing protein [Planctomycetota bacterium]
MLLAREARAAFLAGDPARALELCAQPELELDPDARTLKAAAVERVAHAALRFSDGRDEVALRAALELLARHAPERALALRAALATQAEASARGTGPVPSGPQDHERPAAPALDATRGAIEALLGDRRAARAYVAPAPARGDNAPVSTTGPEPVPPQDPGVPAPAIRPAILFHLAVDDGGEFLVASGARLVLGHLRSRVPDLPFLADVDGEHAELVLAESFHGGLRWRLVPKSPSATAKVNGLAIGSAGAVLADGDRVELARNLAFRFVASETASSSALLELEHGVECRGALRVLLVCPGAAGRVRIGPKRRRLISVPDLQCEVALELREERVRILCDGGMRHGSVTIPAAPGAELSIACPPTGPVDVHVCARPPARPPFLLLFRPLAASRGGPGT